MMGGSPARLPCLVGPPGTPGLGWQQPGGMSGVGGSLLGLRNLGASSLEHLFESCIPAWCSEMETAAPHYC